MPPKTMENKTIRKLFAPRIIFEPIPIVDKPTAINKTFLYLSDMPFLKEKPIELPRTTATAFTTAGIKPVKFVIFKSPPIFFDNVN
jgi:hypothetical protein